MKSSLSLVGPLALVLAPLSHALPVDGAPVAQVRNGTYQGVYNAQYDQDFFLGVPYAQPPVGDLRLRIPHSLNESWSDSRQAVEYSPSCIGYGSDNWVLGNYVSEDCLTLNVVRPAGTAPDAKLPVAVWIHGGGLFMGSGVDPRYNTSFMVEQSVEMETPIVAVTINYRMHAWGFLFGEELAAEGSSLLGFRDQRLALHWVKENIAAFGGDPDHVTIFGESAGAWSVGSQLLAYGGRDDGLFVGAVLQSGAPVSPSPDGTVTTAADWEPTYQRIIAATGCDVEDSLACLRALPTDQLSAVFNSSTTSPVSSWNNVVDGDFFPHPNHDQLYEGNFVPVPIIIGMNFDEGASFGPRGIDTDEQFLAVVSRTGVNASAAHELTRLYPDDPDVGIPATLEGRPTGELAARLGSQYKRAAAFQGDVSMHAPKKLMVEAWVAQGATAYSYHWNVLVNGFAAENGAGHFQEVAFVFNNVNGEGYTTPVSVNPFEGQPETFAQLANLMSRMWISFFVHGDPNYNKANCLRWPVYELEDPKNFVFDVNVTGLGYIEQDVYREAGIDYLVDVLWPPSVEA
ncbi:hypothetical protein S7711_07770 [Stachybotrys chartarum IBT 7711]|uniref:Carboxylic ester hydrolase n=1 Tax=Stachybotrys chartarum (strain CBS 109288 / IBT 7711) TaxID=1280523 RepID=A0A084B8P9_STACB|nr:hypothetical protein S7711_07770 [Stachybotrys chartarum IBT 7711]